MAFSYVINQILGNTFFCTKRPFWRFFSSPNLFRVCLGCVEYKNKKKVREIKVYYIRERLLHNSTLHLYSLLCVIVPIKVYRSMHLFLALDNVFKILDKCRFSISNKVISRQQNQENIRPHNRNQREKTKRQRQIIKKR